MKKQYILTCIKERADSRHTMTGTVEELVESCSYTLECGQSYQHEKGNKKINRNPKSISSLVNNLNNAVNNSAANGYAGKYYISEEITNGT